MLEIRLFPMFTVIFLVWFDHKYMFCVFILFAFFWGCDAQSREDSIPDAIFHPLELIYRKRTKTKSVHNSHDDNKFYFLTFLVFIFKDFLFLMTKSWTVS